MSRDVCECDGHTGVHSVQCPAMAADQPNAMLDDAGGFFYPDDRADAAYYAENYGAQPVNPQAFQALFGKVRGVNDPLSTDRIDVFPPYGGRLYWWRALSEALGLLGFFRLIDEFLPRVASAWWWQLPAWFVLRRLVKGSWFGYQDSVPKT